MARVGGLLFLAGGTLGLLWLVLPHAPGANESGGLLTIVVSFVGGTLLFMFGHHLPRWSLPGVATMGTLAITASVFLSGDRQSAYIMMYLWLVVYVFYFFTRREALIQLALVLSCYTYTAITWQSPNGAISRWLLVVGTLLVVALLVAGLKASLGRLIERLADAARTDPLTRLLNRRGFEEVFDVELERASRAGRSLSLVVGDLDHFKEVNDRLGHHVGDGALKRVSALLDEENRLGDFSARIGGEEFALLVTDADCNGARVVAERARTRLRDEFVDQPVPITISFGIASFPMHGRTTDELLRFCDQALYAAKQRGRDCSVVYSSACLRALTTDAGDSGHSDEPATTLLALAEDVDIRHAGMPGHSQEVGRLAKLTAEELGLPPRAVERLHTAGLLHDVGKVGVAASILCKPGPLDESEWDEMRRHPEIGARILSSAGLRDASQWVLAHHERPDGRGYPRGLRGDEVTLEARILSVADAYEAMVSDRVYRKALGAEEAQRELARCTGTQFDEQVVAAFLRVARRQPGGTRAYAAA